MPGTDPPVTTVPATTAPTVTDPPATTGAPATTAAPTTTVAIDEACVDDPEALTLSLLEARRTGDDDVRCADPIADVVGDTPAEPPCWSECADGRTVTTYEWGEPVETDEGWVVPTVVEYSGAAVPLRVREVFTFTARGDGFELAELAAVNIDGDRDRALTATGGHIDALATGLWIDAAELLAAGNTDPADRVDLEQLFDAALLRPGDDAADLADALREWCDAGALCIEPVVRDPRVDIDTITIVTVYADQTVTGAFRSVEVDDATVVEGLPPNPALDTDFVFDPDFDDWTVEVPGFNDYVDEVAPITARTPVGTAKLMARRADTFGETWVPPSEREEVDIDVIESGETTATVVITRSNLLDDSTAAVRHVVEIERADDGLYRFVSGTQATQCQPGRGHQDFQPAPCT